MPTHPQASSSCDHHRLKPTDLGLLMNDVVGKASNSNTMKAKASSSRESSKAYPIDLGLLNKKDRKVNNTSCEENQSKPLSMVLKMQLSCSLVPNAVPPLQTTR